MLMMTPDLLFSANSRLISDLEHNKYSCVSLCRHQKTIALQGQIKVESHQEQNVKRDVATRDVS